MSLLSITRAVCLHRGLFPSSYPPLLRAGILERLRSSTADERQLDRMIRHVYDRLFEDALQTGWGRAVAELSLITAPKAELARARAEIGLQYMRELQGAVLFRDVPVLDVCELHVQDRALMQIRVER